MENVSLANVRPPRPRTATNTYEASAWRAPSAGRFDSRPANDPMPFAEAADLPENSAEPISLPRWVIVVAGSLIVTMLAVFAANAMAL